jgi:hypothetical protein
VRPGAAGVGPGVERHAAVVVDDCDRARLRQVGALEREERVLAIGGEPLVPADPVAREADEADLEGVGVHQRQLRDRPQPDDERLGVVRDLKRVRLDADERLAGEPGLVA